MTSYTNHAQEIFDKIKELILGEFTELKTRNRYVERSYPKNTDFAAEYSFRIELLENSILEQYNTARTDEYIFRGYFAIKQSETDYSEITKYAEHLKALFLSYKEVDEWSLILTSFDFRPESIAKPEDYTGRIDGFVVNFRAIKTIQT